MAIMAVGVQVPLRVPRGNSSVGRARPCQGRGREFESRFPLIIETVSHLRYGFSFYNKSVLFIADHFNIRVDKFIFYNLTKRPQIHE